MTINTQSRYYDQGLHFFVNNCMGSFFRGTLNWFSDIFYPRINYKVIGTYEKSVEYFNKKKTHEHEIDTNILPSITLDPAYEFQPEERGGKFFWQYPYLAPGLGRKLFNRIAPLQNDQGIDFVPVYTRYEGAFDLIFWLHSVYELFDFRVYMLQFCGGYNRQIRPTIFDSSILLPDEIVNYTYTDSEGNEKTIDWSDTDLSISLIDNMGSTQYVYPIKLNPFFKLASLSDSSEKYGGDSISRYKLTATFEYEIELPTYFVITPFTKNITTDLNISMGSTYSRYGLMPTYNSSTGQYEKGGNYPPTDRLIDSSDSEIDSKPVYYNSKTIYLFTENDENNYTEGSLFELTNTYGSDIDWRNLQIISYTGLLDYGQDWSVSDDTTKLLLNIEPIEGEQIELFYYSDENE